MSVLNGPGEGTWSVFAKKVVEERDALSTALCDLNDACVQLEKELAALRAENKQVQFDGAEERIRNYLQAMGMPEHKTSKIAKWLLTGEK